LPWELDDWYFLIIVRAAEAINGLIFNFEKGSRMSKTELNAVHWIKLSGDLVESSQR
jgi:hypothetical protein